VPEPAGHQASDAFLQVAGVVAAVAAEQLVGAVSRQRYRDVPARHARQVEHRNGRGVAEGLVEMPHQHVQHLVDGRGNDVLAVIGLVAVGHQAGEAPLV